MKLWSFSATYTCDSTRSKHATACLHSMHFKIFTLQLASKMCFGIPVFSIQFATPKAPDWDALHCLRFPSQTGSRFCVPISMDCKALFVVPLSCLCLHFSATPGSLALSWPPHLPKRWIRWSRLSDWIMVVSKVVPGLRHDKLSSNLVPKSSPPVMFLDVFWMVKELGYWGGSLTDITSFFIWSLSFRRFERFRSQHCLPVRPVSPAGETWCSDETHCYATSSVLSWVNGFHQLWIRHRLCIKMAS